MIRLGQCEVDLSTRELRRSGRPVRLGSRAFDILAVLLASPGRLVTKKEMMHAVWPDVSVEESNIHVQLYMLRKALGADHTCIVNVPGRGYVFVPGRIDSGAVAGVFADSGRNTLPTRRARLIGRGEAIVAVRATLSAAPVLTLVGAGGVGKTTLAIAIARQIEEEGAMAVNAVELAALTDRSEVLRAFFQSCGLATDERELDVVELRDRLSGGPRLLFIDNAEHVVDEVATLVEKLMRGNEQLRFLVTSRERLRVREETVVCVEPLDTPPANAEEREILEHSAVQLFLSRAQATEAIGLDRSMTRQIGEICRRLDGIPLAIELAAAQVCALGIDGVHSRLDDRLALLTGNSDAELPHHQTLRATFDWSYRLLDETSRKLFRRLAIFGGAFTLGAMCATICDDCLTFGLVIDGIGDLVAKSLVNVEFDGPVVRYRLPESARAYALEQVESEGEFYLLASRNVRYLSAQLDPAEFDEDTTGVAGANSIDVEHHLDDARNIFEWAFSERGDLRLGVELASTMVGALMKRGQLDECAKRAEQAVAAIDGSSERLVDAITEMRVKAALATVLPHLNGPVQRAVDLWRTVSRLADENGNNAFRLRALWGQWDSALYAADIKEALRITRRFRRYASKHRIGWHRTLADQMFAVTLHWRGRHGRAKALIEASLHYLNHHPGDVEQIERVANAPIAHCYGTLARIEWLSGRTELAMDYVDKAVNLIAPDAAEPYLTHLFGVLAAPLAFLSGDIQRASHYLEIMRSQATVHRFTTWRAYSTCLITYRDILEGRAVEVSTVLKSSVDALLDCGFRRVLTPLVVICAEVLVAEGRLEEASKRLCEALNFCALSGEGFFVPELWRALGVTRQAEAASLTLHSGAQRRKIAQAQACYERAIGIARTQGAMMFELRARLELARLFGVQRRLDEAIAVLEPMSTCCSVESAVVDVRELFRLLSILRSGDGQTDDAEWRAAVELSVRRRLFPGRSTRTSSGVLNASNPER
jgi:predicted ATPase